LPLHTVNEVKITPIKVKKRYPPPWKLKVVKVFLKFYVYLCTHKSEYTLFKGFRKEIPFVWVPKSLQMWSLYLKKVKH